MDDEYDRLYVTVRRDIRQELIGAYGMFGWEVAFCEERRVRGNLTDMAFRRPHKIARKDELQLLQVYMEAALNTVGRLEKTMRPRTAAYGLTSFFAVCALVAAGLCLMLLAGGAACTAAGVLCLCVGGADALLAVCMTVRMYRREGKQSLARLEQARREISAVCAEAKKITQGGEDAQ